MLRPTAAPVLECPYAADPPEAWDHLDRFLTLLQTAPDINRQLRATLETVRASTRADVVCLYSSQAQQILDTAGSLTIATEVCSDLVRQVLSETGQTENHLLRSDLGSSLASHPGSSLILVRLSRSRGVWVLALRLGPGGPLGQKELKLISLVRRLLRQQQQQTHTQDQLREVLFSLVRCLTASLDARDPYTWGHSERVARIGVRLARQIGLSESTQSEVYLGGLLHDIGKIGVPDSTLRKPGRLTDEEMDQVKQHVVIGDTIVAHVKQLAHLRPLVRNHHEQYDGSGYPDGLKGEQIPLLARILAVADAFDAMMSDRPYRKAMPTDRIEQIFRTGSGSQWDADIIEAFFACREEVYTIGQRGLGESVVRAVEHALNTGNQLAGAIRSFAVMRPSQCLERD